MAADRPSTNEKPKVPDSEALGLTDGHSMALKLAHEASGPQLDESQLGLAKTMLHSVVHSAIQEPLTGVTQLFGMKAPELISAQPQAEFGSKSWYAQTIGSGVGMVAPFLLTEMTTSAIINKRGAIAGLVSERVPMAAGLMKPLTLTMEEMSPRMRAIAPIAKSTLDGAVFGLVFTPSNDPNKGFWEQRFVSAASGGLTFGTQAAVSQGLMNKWAKAGFDVHNPVFSHSLKGIPIRVGTNMIGGAVAGTVSAESTSLLSGQGFAKPEDVWHSVASFVVTGGALDAVHIVKEVRAEKKQGNHAIAYGGELARQVEAKHPAEGHAADVKTLAERVAEQLNATGKSSDALRVMRSVDTILNSKQLAVDLTPAERLALSKQILMETLNPKSINQGIDLTCGPAVAQEMLLHNSPGQYADAIAKLVTTGKYTGGGKTVDLSSEMLSHLPPEYRDVLKPDAQAKRSLEAGTEAGNAPRVEAERTYASQLAQLLAGNMHTQNLEPGSRSIYVKGAADPLRAIDTGERLFKITDKPQFELVTNPSGKPEVGPNLSIRDLQPIFTAISGKPAQNNPFVLINTADPVARKEGRGYQTVEELGKLLEKSNGPVVIQVDPMHRLFDRGGSTAHDMSHALLAQVVRDPATGKIQIDARTGTPKVEIFDQYGRQHDYTGERALSTADLFEATRGVDTFRVGRRNQATDAVGMLKDRAQNQYFKERLGTVERFLAERAEVPASIKGDVDLLVQLSRTRGFNAQEIRGAVDAITRQMPEIRRNEAAERQAAREVAQKQESRRAVEDVLAKYGGDPDNAAAIGRLQRMFAENKAIDSHAVEILNKLATTDGVPALDVVDALDYAVSRQELTVVRSALAERAPEVQHLRPDKQRLLADVIDGQLRRTSALDQPRSEWAVSVHDLGKGAEELAYSAKVMMTPEISQQAGGLFMRHVEAVREGYAGPEVRSFALWQPPGRLDPVVQAPPNRQPQIWRSEAEPVEQAEPKAPARKRTRAKPAVEVDPNAVKFEGSHKASFNRLSPEAQPKIEAAVREGKLAKRSPVDLERLDADKHVPLLDLAKKWEPRRDGDYFPLEKFAADFTAEQLKKLATADDLLLRQYEALPKEIAAAVLDAPAEQRAFLEGMLARTNPGTFSRLMLDTQLNAARRQTYNELGIATDTTTPRQVIELLVRNHHDTAEFGKLYDFFKQHGSDPKAAEAAAAITRETDSGLRKMYLEVLNAPNMTPSVLADLAATKPGAKQLDVYGHRLTTGELSAEQLHMLLTKLDPEARQMVFDDVLNKTRTFDLKPEKFQQLLDALAAGENPALARVKTLAELKFNDPDFVRKLDDPRFKEQRVLDAVGALFSRADTPVERQIIASWLKSDTTSLLADAKRYSAVMKDAVMYGSGTTKTEFLNTVKELMERPDQPRKFADAAEIAAIIHFGEFTAKLDATQPELTKQAEQLHASNNGGTRQQMRGRGDVLFLELQQPELFEHKPSAKDVAAKIDKLPIDQLIAFTHRMKDLKPADYAGVDVPERVAEAIRRHQKDLSYGDLRRFLMIGRGSPDVVRTAIAETALTFPDPHATADQQATLSSKTYRLITSIEDPVLRARVEDTLFQKTNENLDLIDRSSPGVPSYHQWFVRRLSDVFAGELSQAGVPPQEVLKSIESIAGKRTGQVVTPEFHTALMEALERQGLKTPAEKARAIEALNLRAHHMTVSGLNEMFRSLSKLLAVGGAKSHYVTPKSDRFNGMAPSINTLLIGDGSPGTQLVYHYFKEAETHFNVFRLDPKQSTAERLVIADAQGRKFEVTQQDGKPSAKWLDTGEAREVPRFVMFDNPGIRAPELQSGLTALQNADHVYLPKQLVGEAANSGRQEVGFTGDLNMYDLARAMNDPHGRGMNEFARRLAEAARSESLNGKFNSAHDQDLNGMLTNAIRGPEYYRTEARVLKMYRDALDQAAGSKKSQKANQIKNETRLFDEGIKYRSVADFVDAARTTYSELVGKVGGEHNMQDVIFVILRKEGSAHFVHEAFRQANDKISPDQFKTEAELRKMADEGKLAGKRLVLLDDNFDYGRECLGKLDVVADISERQNKQANGNPDQQIKEAIIANIYTFDNAADRVDQTTKWRKSKEGTDLEEAASQLPIEYVTGTQASEFKANASEINISGLDIGKKKDDGLEKPKYGGGSNTKGAAELWPHLMPNNSSPLVVRFARQIGHFSTRINSGYDLYKPLAHALPFYLDLASPHMSAKDRADVMALAMYDVIARQQEHGLGLEKKHLVAAKAYHDALMEAQLNPSLANNLLQIPDRTYTDTRLERKPAMAQVRADILTKEALDFSILDRNHQKHDLNYTFNDLKPTIQTNDGPIQIEGIRCKDGNLVVEYTRDGMKVTEESQSGRDTPVTKQLLEELRNAQIPGASGNEYAQSQMIAAYLDRLAWEQSGNQGKTAKTSRKKSAEPLTPEQKASAALARDLKDNNPLELTMKTAHRKYELNYDFSDREVALKVDGREVIITGLKLEWDKWGKKNAQFFGEDGKPLPSELANKVQLQLENDLSTTHLREYFKESTRATKVVKTHLTALYLDRLARIQHGEELQAQAKPAESVPGNVAFRFEDAIRPQEAPVRRYDEEGYRKLRTEEDVDFSRAQKIDSGEHTVSSGVYEVSGNAKVTVTGNAVVRVRGDATVNAAGDSRVIAEGRAQVYAGDGAQVTASGESFVRLDGEASAKLSGNARSEAYGMAQVEARDQAHIHASGRARVDAFDKAIVVAEQNTQVTAKNNSTVKASGEADIFARDSSHVTASGRARVSARGNSKVISAEEASVTAYGAAEVDATGSGHISLSGAAKGRVSGEVRASARGSSELEASGNARVDAHDDALVNAFDNAHVVTGVEANDRAEIHAQDSSTVEAWGISLVHAYDNAHVIANDASSVQLHDHATAEATTLASITTHDQATFKRGGEARLRIPEMDKSSRDVSDKAYPEDAPIVRTMRAVEPSIVNVWSQKTAEGGRVYDAGGGTGFFVGADGYLATAYHVVEGSSGGVEVTIGGKRYKAKVVEVDAGADVALLKVDQSAPIPSDIPQLAFDTTAADNHGIDVVVIGRPDAKSRLTVSPGEVTGAKTLDSFPDAATKFDPHEDLALPLIDINAGTRPGNSGSPLIRLSDGAVIGVVTKGGDNIGRTLATSLDRIKKMLESARSNRSNQ